MKRDLVQLSDNIYDVLIIGGGIYGLFVAWDAALRGLSVALVEKGDFGHATSFNSLKIIHGGLRYLQHGDIRRLLQSMHERMAFMKIAPYLVHPQPFLIPTYGHLMRGKEILSMALMMNDLIGFNRNRLEDPQKYLPRSHSISREECLQLCPGVEKKGLTGGIIFYDCQMYSSERLIFGILRSASDAGADLANYTEVTGFLRKGDRVTGVRVRDIFRGDTLDIQAKIVVNTSGPWMDGVLRLLNGYSPNNRLLLSKTFNLLIDRQLVQKYAVGVYSKTRCKDQDAILSKGYRLLIITPWRDRSLIGTVHLPYDGDPDNLKVTEGEIHDFIGEINEGYPEANLKRRDICFSYVGLLPISGNSNEKDNVQLLKGYQIHDHQKEASINGMVSVAGVKFTEARHVAEKTVDLVFRKLGRVPPKSSTSITPIYGGEIDRFNDFLVRETQRGSQELSVEAIRRLIYGYGSAYKEVLKYIDNNSRLSSTSTEASSVMKAEVLHGIKEEMAQKLSDVVFRRTDLGLSGDPGNAVLKECAAIMGRELNWDEVRTRIELGEVREIFSTRT